MPAKLVVTSPARGASLGSALSKSRRWPCIYDDTGVSLLREFGFWEGREGVYFKLFCEVGLDERVDLSGFLRML